MHVCGEWKPVLIGCTSTVIPLEIWDCPGASTWETIEAPLTQFSTLIFVIDIQVSCARALRALITDLVVCSPIGLLPTADCEAGGFGRHCVPGEPRYAPGGVCAQGGCALGGVQNW